ANAFEHSAGDVLQPLALRNHVEIVAGSYGEEPVHLIQHGAMLTRDRHDRPAIARMAHLLDERSELDSLRPRTIDDEDLAHVTSAFWVHIHIARPHCTSVA